MAQQIYNTLSGSKELFEPLTPGKLGIYVCGPTVYDMAHVGHARVYIAFDTIVRYLRRRHDVTFVRNFTDVDDKIIKRAAELGESAATFSERYIAEFLADMDTLNVARADVEPKVTEHIPEIVELIEILVERGFAYSVDTDGDSGSDVYYAVDKFEGYGKLGRRVLDDMEAGARVEVDQRKRNPMDFALWKGVDPNGAATGAIAAWESPWGSGRPGWHIECSAMTKKYLGDTLDIHAGGKDLIFPHHENEIAQSEAASGKLYSRYWMHNGFVNIDNEKMSKSLGNFFTVREVLKKFDAQTIRYYLLTTHYRSPINFSDQSLEQAEVRVKYVYETLRRLGEAVGDTSNGGSSAGPSDGPYRGDFVGEIIGRFEAAMDDDFNTAKVLGELSEVFKAVNEILDHAKDSDTDARTLRAIAAAVSEVGSVLGLFCEAPSVVLERMEKRRTGEAGIDPAQIDELVAARVAARKNKDFARADEIRDELSAMGVVIKDTAAGTAWEMA